MEVKEDIRFWQTEEMWKKEEMKQGLEDAIDDRKKTYTKKRL